MSETIGPSHNRRRRRGFHRRSVLVDTESTHYSLFDHAAKEMGYSTSESQCGLNGARFTIMFRDKPMSYNELPDWPKDLVVNRLPGMGMCARKMFMGQVMNEGKDLFPDFFSFWPDTWLLPNELQKLIEDSKRGRRNKNNAAKTYIVKPDAGSQGDGIYLTQSPTQIITRKPMVVQRYISRPFLVDGYKFDVRLYLIVISLDPLCALLHREGVVRLCTERYHRPNQKNIRSNYMHLTNYSVNKHSDKFIANVDVADDSFSSKRSLSTFFQQLEYAGHDVVDLWNLIKILCANTCAALFPSLAAAIPEVRLTRNCFHILGFDVMFDCKLRPWLLEVNNNPAMTCDTPIDLAVKGQLAADTMRVLAHRNFFGEVSTNNTGFDLLRFSPQPPALRYACEENLFEYFASGFMLKLMKLAEALGGEKERTGYLNRAKFTRFVRRFIKPAVDPKKMSNVQADLVYIQTLAFFGYKKQPNNPTGGMAMPNAITKNQSGTTGSNGSASSGGGMLYVHFARALAFLGLKIYPDAKSPAHALALVLRNELMLESLSDVSTAHEDM